MLYPFLAVNLIYFISWYWLERRAVNLNAWISLIFFSTEQEMIGNSILFIIAGQDSTASSLAFLVYELVLSPEIQDRVVAEIAEVLPNKVCNITRD